MTATATGGNGVFTYTIDGIAATSNVFTVTAGLHTVVVTDGNGCSATATITINQNNAVGLTLAETHAIACFGGTATVTATATGGNGVFTYTIDGIAATSNVFTVTAGIHTVVVTDGNGCSATATITINQAAQLVVAITPQVPVCNNGTATITATVSGGIPPYSYTVNGIAYNSNTFNLQSGSYTIIATDANGCTGTGTVAFTCVNNCQFTTFTQGGYGATPHGNNPGVYVHSNFSGAFPSGLAIGCNSKLKLTTAQAVTDFLPSGSTPATLPAGTLINPGGTYNNVLAGQLVAAMLSVGFDMYDPNFSPSSQNLGSLTISTGTFTGWTAAQLIDSANHFIGGCGSAYSASQYNAALTAFNENFDNGIVNNGYLNCPDYCQLHPVSLTLAVTTPVNCNGSNATVTATATGGSAPYQYSTNGTNWSTSSTFSLAAGTYTIYVKDAQGCTKTATITVVPAASISLALTITQPILCSGGTGTIKAVATGGNGSYMYSLNGTTWGINNIFNLPAGTYTIYAKSGSCTTSSQITIDESQALHITIAVITPIACNGGTATVKVTATGGMGNYQYSSNGTTWTSNNVFTVPAGTYTFWAKHCTSYKCQTCSCPTSSTIIIAQPAALNLTAAITPIACNGGSATITATATGGTAPYQFSINGTTWTSSNTFIVGTGNYTVYVKDANGCTKSSCIQVTQPAALNLTAAVTTPTNCNGTNATVTATVTGGTAPYQYSTNGTSWASANTFSLAAGTYTIYVKDAAGCTKTATVTVAPAASVNLALTITQPILCSGGTATVKAVATGGNGSYQYSLNGTSWGINNIFSLPAGTYTIYAKSGSCTTSSQIIIDESQALHISIAVTNPIACNGGTATVTVTATGGMGNYQYSSNGTTWTTNNVFTLPAGTYTLWARHCTSYKCQTCTCPTSETITITQPAAISLTTAITTPIACNGGNAAVTATATGGTAPYQYSMNGTNWSTNNTFSLAAGTYNIKVKDANGCMQSSYITISQPAVIGLSLSVTTAITCNGGSATLTASVSGGTAPYQYSTNGTNWSSANTFSLTAGTYTIYVKDAGGCTKNSTITITQPAPISLSLAVTTPILCGGGSGIVTATATGGLAPYKFSLNGTTWTTNNTFSLTAGTYTIYVKDANNCVNSGQITVTQSQALNVTAAIVTPISCYGGYASVKVTATGGMGNFQYSQNGTTWVTSNIFSLPAGTYTLWARTCTSAKCLTCSCPTSVTITITQPAAVNLALGITTPIACNGGMATVTATATGGTAPYQFRLNSGAWGSANTFSLAPGSYTISVKDANGCAKTATIAITQPAALTAMTAVVGTNVDLTVGGGTAPYTYHWSNGATTQDLTGVPGGTYSVVVTDANGCTVTATAIVVTCPYEVGDMTASCDDPNLPTICVPLIAVNPPTPGTIGMDYCMTYDPQLMTPTGQVTLGPVVLNGSQYANYYINASTIPGTVCVSIYYTSQAQYGAQFQGTGEVACIGFVLSGNYPAGTTANFSVDTTLESYVTSTAWKCVDDGSFNVTSDNTLEGRIILHNIDSKPLRYDVAHPTNYLVTNISGTNGSCAMQHANVNVPDVNGNFLYNIVNGTSVQLSRDIPNNSCPSVMNVINGNDCYFTSMVTTMNNTWTPNAYQIIAMDVNMDGVVSAGDITLMQNRTVLSICEFPQAWNYPNPIKPSKDWLFVDNHTVTTSPAYVISSSYPMNDGHGYSRYRVPATPTCMPAPVINNGYCSMVDSVLYHAILLGDVDANWNGNTTPVVLKSEKDKLVIDLSAATTDGNSMYIPVTVESADNVTAVDFDMDYNQSVLTFNTIRNANNEMSPVFNNLNNDRLMFTSYSMNAAGSKFSTAPFIVQFTSSNNVITSADLGTISAYINGQAVITEVRGTANVQTAAVADIKPVTPNVIIYPNPISEEMTVLYTDGINRIEVYDVTGKLLLQTNYDKLQKVELDVTTLAHGIYAVKINGNIIRTVVK
ncbi:MAG: T9SS type A sorting domain-containing protein [Bacteroidota bacterium]